MRHFLSLVLLLTAASASAAIPASERDALVALYQSTNGASWTDHTGWLGAPGTECTWFGVGCDETQTKVIGLDLRGNALAGPIPSQLASLSALTTLRLGFNELSGTFPASIGQLHALEALDLQSNHLSGVLPDAIADLGAIKQFDLRANQFSGALPAALYRLTTLEELQLSTNLFSGSLAPQIGDLRKLQAFNAYDNRLTGSIPAELGNIDTLRELELESNALTGPIPQELSRAASLTVLGVAHNQLTGSIPPQLGLLSRLEVLSLYDNAIDGTIPRELGQLGNLRILSIATNKLRGSIPDELRNLTKLNEFNADHNQLGGVIPIWIGEWPALTNLFLGDNRFSGTLPPGLATLDNLLFLDLSGNQFTGHFIDLTRLTKLVYITVNFNELTGALPSSIGLLTNLTYAAFGNNNFSGPLPPEIGGLVNVEYLDLTVNEFDGPIPKEMAKLKKAYALSMHSNHFSGTLPKELGQLTSLQFLELSFNALKGPIPTEITAMTGLEDHRSDFSFNGLYANDPATRAFVNLKQYDGDFELTQTLMPANVRVVATTDRSATLRWDPIRYAYYGGGYQVTASTTPNGAPVTIATTSSKSLDTITVRNLQPATTYSFTVATVSHPISGQENLITSDRTAPVQATTKQRTLAPPDVVMTDPPNAMVQIDGVEVQGDSFTLTNFGDVATTITLQRDENFFTLEPEQFSLAGGASQTMTLHAATQPAGTYYGYVSIDGAGVPDDLYASIVLLSSARPSGTVVATPLATRIELAGAAGSDEVGTAQFRNTGTARLTGIVLSDQAWVEVAPEPITIEPGAVGSVNFTIVRSKRPQNAQGALTANLSLVYVSGDSSARTIAALGTTNVSITKVTIVDVTQPTVFLGSIPALQAGEIPFFIPGLTSTASQRSDVSLINATGAQPIDDLRLYFTGGAQTSVAALQPLAFAQSIDLVNILGSVYGAEGGGALQVRTTSPASISAGAKVTTVTDAGTYTGAIPVFRGDRSAPPAAPIYLAGLTAGGDLFVQETGGSAGSVSIAYLDGSGNSVATRSENLGAYALLELRNAIPANAATAIVIGVGVPITAYARLHDASGDSWSVVDWSRFYQYERKDTVRVPLADGRGGTTRRRAIRHDADAPRRATELVLFNPGDAEVRATLEVIDTSGRMSERSATVASHATATLHDVAALAGSTVAHVTIAPVRGELVVTARTRGASSGSAIPVLAATAGVRLGQSQVFSNLDDAAALHTGYGFVETGGSTTKVRARIIISEVNALVSTVTERSFTLAPREQVYLPELVRSFAGDLRDTAYGDLHGLVLEIEVIEGTGAIVPFIVATDSGTHDVSVQVQ